MAAFVHLHVHTHYSVLDGLSKVPELVARVSDLAMPAVAITDHGNLFGALEFQKACDKQGVKPIFGCEIRVRHDGDPRPFHLVLLAADQAGYRNLVSLVSRGHIQAQGQEMWLELEQLAERAEGLLALTGDLGGAIPQAFLRGQRERAEAILERYRDIFGPENVFLEVQRHGGLPEQELANAGLFELSARHDAPLLATADCHYVRQDHADAQAVLMCIGMDKRVDFEDLDALPVKDLYLKSPAEMAALWSDLPEAVENTLRVAERCNARVPVGEIFLPQYDVPEGHNLETYFESLSREGLEARLAERRRRGGDEAGEGREKVDQAAYWEQLEHELAIIKQMGYPGYFLIVWDFIAYAKRSGIPVGPGRGSGAGSVVAWALRITDVDPLRYGLLFERFLNPERVSMPDFDIDFCMNRRGEVIDYVTERYGRDNVGQIVTFGQLKARACIRDVARVLNISYGEADRLAKLVPAELGITLEKAYKAEPRLREAVESEDKLQTLYRLARALEGTNRNTGIHAAGVVIADSPLWDYVPVTLGAAQELVTQFAKDEVEQAGLVKFDFLGLRNLTVIADAVRLVNEQRDASLEPFEIEQIPLDDPAVFQLLSSGETMGIFQMESSGFQELMRKLRPNAFEDIIAAGALYRPGPLASGMVDDYIDCKHGQKEPEYPHPWIEGILQETYGVFVYQEQVMQTAQILAGYTLGGADLLRRAMGKKKKEEMARQRAIFLKGAEDKGVDLGVAGDIFDKMALFAGYGFNKSHSTAYAMVTYQTAYLKAHYPVAFMAALMTCDADRTDRVVRLIQEAKARSIRVLPPDVNASRLDFTVVADKIRFGLGAIKGVGHAAIEAISEAAEESPFTGLFDFCERVDVRRVNRKVVETLVKCGAFDSLSPEPLPPGDLDALGAWRASLFAAVPTALESGQRAQADREVGQGTLFDMLARPQDAEARYPDAEPWSDRVLLEAEKETLGFYVSGHPLDRYEEELALYATHDTRKLERAAERDEVRIGGVVQSIRERRSKQGDGRHAFVVLEDRHGWTELLVFSRVYADCEELLKGTEPVLAHGSVRIEGDEEPRERKVVCERVQALTEARLEAVRRVVISVCAEALDPELARSLRQVIEAHPGDCRTELNLSIELAGDAHFALPASLSVSPTDELLNEVERLLGRGSVSLA